MGHFLLTVLGQPPRKLQIIIIFGIIFSLIILPIGLILWLFGNDPMQRKRDLIADSYHVEHNGAEQKIF